MFGLSPGPPVPVCHIRKHPAGGDVTPPFSLPPPPRPPAFPQILLFNLPVNFAQGTSIFWAYVVGFREAPLTAIQV